MNRKGFALTETLVVVVFLVTIFTFVYVSIVPLIGEYENMVDVEKDIDIIYKLSRVRELIMSDDNRSSIVTLPDGKLAKKITCGDFDRDSFCAKVMEQMELGSSNNYVIIYANEINNGSIADIKTLDGEIGAYAEKYKNEINNKVLFLLDKGKHTIGYLYYDDLIWEKNEG